MSYVCHLIPGCFYCRSTLVHGLFYPNYVQHRPAVSNLSCIYIYPLFRYQGLADWMAAAAAAAALFTALHPVFSLVSPFLPLRIEQLRGRLHGAIQVAIQRKNGNRIGIFDRRRILSTATMAGFEGGMLVCEMGGFTVCASFWILVIVRVVWANPDFDRYNMIVAVFFFFLFLFGYSFSSMGAGRMLDAGWLLPLLPSTAS
ncbi:hypothetical protein B0T22DRAFT_227915 [Podospora appendiculata]|uniref:Uncharacterized protein n=1 Tax=Podospora appendiculata TaxID=314037 RepID=A0AAE1CAP5_9PEZI|nr:hypothetical protein B0T22DRAFT_227915 [Podospora appendiculata]